MKECRKNTVEITLVFKIFIGIVFAYGLLTLGIYASQRGLMYHPGQEDISSKRYKPPAFHVVSLETEDGLRLASWYREAESGQPTVLYFHGNAGSIVDRVFKTPSFIKNGMGILLVEYRGFGGNEGVPEEEGLYRDAEAAFSYLSAQGVSPEDMILYGESLGSGIAVYLAVTLAARGKVASSLILEAPFSSMVDAARVHYPFLPVKWLVKDRYPSIDIIGNIMSPLLIIHGKQDKTVPIALGKKLFMKAKEPKHFIEIENAGHRDLYDFGAASEIIRFIDRYRE